MAQRSSPSEDLIEFWLDKAVEWGQATTFTSQQDVCLHLQKLRTFLQQLCQKLQTMNTTVAMRTFPLVGQLFGRLCWNPYVIADEESQRTLLQCLWCLYSAEPQNTVELKANDWLWNLLCHLISEEDKSAASTSLQTLSCIPEELHSNLVKDMVSSLVTELAGICHNGIHMPARPLSDRLHSLSVLCLPLVTHPEAAPLIGTLLLCPEFGHNGALSAEFLEAVGKAVLEKKLVLDEPEVMSLWLRCLPSLEKATLHLIDSLVSNESLLPQDMEHLMMDSLLPKASAYHAPIFLTVKDIFRQMLLESSENTPVQSIIRLFTRCFVQSLLLEDMQERLPLKVFFPHHPQSLVMALLKLPSEVPSHVWEEHLKWISWTLRNVVEVEELTGSCQRLFENWFLLVQCGDWVDVAAQHLTASDSETSGALLWLLAFYHHPNNESQQRSESLAVARGVCDHLKSLFASAPPTAAHLETLLSLAATDSQQCRTPHLIDQLAVNFVVFSEGGNAVAKEVVRAMMHWSSRKVVSALKAGIEHRLNRYGLMDFKAHSRLKIMQEVLQEQLRTTI
uniref:FA complementation group C n=2 Tax=Lepisosteus oculatus TaxID=7918 RepID=W5MSF2_LEPOC